MRHKYYDTLHDAVSREDAYEGAAGPMLLSSVYLARGTRQRDLWSMLNMTLCADQLESAGITDGLEAACALNSVAVGYYARSREGTSTWWASTQRSLRRLVPS